MLVRFRLKLLGMVLVAAYGATGFDGLAHYTLGLCSEHTLATNLTIWFEVLTGVTLLVASSLWIPKTESLRSVKNWLPYHTE